MIVEGLVTTLNERGELNVAPMGPIVPDEHVHSEWTELLLRPFHTSQTYRNLRVVPCGVFHIVDDVELIARAALHGLMAEPGTCPAAHIPGRVLADACRWYEFRVRECDDREPRTRLVVDIVHTGRLRDATGYNRAQHAVIEATILATRLHLVSEAEVREELQRWASPVEKTSGPRERAAWDFVTSYVDGWYRSQSAAAEE